MGRRVCSTARMATLQRILHAAPRSMPLHSDPWLAHGHTRADEQRDIVDWARYHEALGVDRIYVVDSGESLRPVLEGAGLVQVGRRGGDTRGGSCCGWCPDSSLPQGSLSLSRGDPHSPPSCLLCRP